MNLQWIMEEQITGIPRQHEGVTKTAKCGGLDVSDAKRLRAFAGDNGKLKQVLTNDMLDNTASKELLSKGC